MGCNFYLAFCESPPLVSLSFSISLTQMAFCWICALHLRSSIY